MILLVLTALTAVCGAAKLDRTYLPPASAKTAGGSPGSLQTPLTGSFNQGIGELPAGGYTNDAQGVVVDAALTGTRSTGESEQSGLGGPRPSYGSTASKVGDAAFRGSQNNFGAPLSGQVNGAFEVKPERPQATQDRNSNIITYENNVDINNYNYGFETDNGIAVGENGVAHDGVHAQGGYSYKGDDGQVYSVTYTADKNGYKPQGNHLPTAPPIPDEILKSIEQNKKDEAAGLVDDGSYDAQKYNAEGDYTESDSNKYNGEQQSQFDKRPGSDTTSNGAVINQNGLNSGPANGAQTQNDVPTIIPGLSSQTFTGQPLPGFGQLAQIGSQFISKPGGQNGFDSLISTGSAIGSAVQHGLQSLKPQFGQSSIIPSTFPSLLPNQGPSLLGGSTSQTNIGSAIIGSFTQFDEAQGTPSTANNQQSSSNDEQPIAQNSLTYTGTSSKPGIQQFGSNYKPAGTTTNNFGQAGQSGFINNEYLPPFSDAGQTQLNYNAQPQKPGAFTFSTNKPFGSIVGFPTPSGSPPGQFTSSTLNSQSSYGNQQQVSGSIESVSRPGLLQSTSPQGSTETASNNFGSFKPQNSVPQADLSTSMKQNEEKHEGDAGAQGQISNNPSQPSTSTTTSQIGTSQFPSQTGQNSHVAGFQSFKPTFGSYNTQKQPSAFPVQQPQGQGQINELLTSSNRPSSFQTGFTQNDAFGTQSSPASVQQFQGQRPFSGNQQPSYTQNAFSTQPQIPTIPSQQLSQPLSGGQPPQSFQNGFNQNNGFNTKPSSTPGKQPQGQISQPGLINKPQPLQTGLSQNGAFASQNKPLSSSNLQPQGQNQFGQASIGNKPQTFQNGFTQTGAFGINKPTNPTLVQNQQNQFSSGQKQPSPFQTGFSQNNNLFGQPTASSGSIQNAFGSQRPQTQSTTSPFNNQPIVVQQPQGADHSYYYNQPTKPFSTPSLEIQQGGKVPFSSKPSNIPTVDKIKYPSTEDQEEYANSTSKPEQQPGASQPVFNGVTQASASPFPTKPTIPSAQFGNTFGVKPQQVLTPQKPQTFLQSGQQFSKPESVQSTIQNVNNQYKPQKGVSQDEPAKTDSEDSFNPSESKPTQQYDGELYQYNKPEPVLAPGTEQEDSSDDKSSNEQPQTKPQFDQDSQSPSKTETKIQTSSFGATKPTNQFSFGITPQQPTSQSQFGSQPFKPFGDASLPGSLPAKGQFGQNSQSSFTNIPTSQLAGFQFGTPPLKPFGQQPTGAFGSNLKPQFGQTQQTKPQFDQSLNVSPQTSQSSQPGFGSPVTGTQGFPTQFGNQGYKPFGVAQTPTKPQFGFPSNAQAGQIQSPNYNQQSISKFGFQTYKPFGSQIPANIPQIGQSQPIFGSNQAQPARGQYNDYQTQFPASTKPEFGQSSANAYASSSPVISNSQAFRQPNKPFGFQPASSPSSYSQRPSQESEASSSATAQGPSATASAQASTGQESEVQAKPAFGKPCCKIAQFGQTSNQDAQNQETKGEEFSGPKQPQRFDEKTGYHY